MTSFTLPTLPGELSWLNTPREWRIEPDGGLSITAGEKTDWFIDPNGSFTGGSAPVALFTPPDGDFMLSAKVTVDFGATFDAGVLFLYGREDVWAKLCFEFSPQRRPMVVTVVTRGVSDDCNVVTIDGDSVWLRVSRLGPTFAYHYSADGARWHMARYFSLGEAGPIRAGFSAQSPMASRCRAAFFVSRLETGHAGRPAQRRVARRVGFERCRWRI